MTFVGKQKPIGRGRAVRATGTTATERFSRRISGTVGPTVWALLPGAPA